MRRRLWPLLVLSTVLFALLFSLGVWQVRRLEQKNALIAKIDGRIAADPTDLATVLAQAEKGYDVEYIRVGVAGRFIAPDLRKITTFDGEASQELIAPFLTTGNTVILVDRGAVPDNAKPTPVFPGQQTLIGIVRAHNMGQGLFDVENDATGNQWFWWDIPAMLGSVPVPPDAKVSDLVLQLVPDGAAKDYPRPAVPKAELRNNHLGYAITWFGLAAVWAAMTGVLVLRQRAGRGT